MWRCVVKCVDNRCRAACLPTVEEWLRDEAHSRHKQSKHLPNVTF